MYYNILAYHTVSLRNFFCSFLHCTIIFLTVWLKLVVHVVESSVRHYQCLAPTHRRSPVLCYVNFDDECLCSDQDFRQRKLFDFSSDSDSDETETTESCSFFFLSFIAYSAGALLCPQYAASAAFLQADARPMFCWPRSASTAQSQVWLGLPNGRFQFGGSLRITAATARWWSSCGELLDVQLNATNWSLRLTKIPARFSGG